ncbi:hypothetical protein QN277_027333 [Acacia crassicarpa]|uniref:BHLH domain-containing protein n=1 Tax=Acacia crassicarpa TaxID=499986 RepID=A0AAE1K5W5_9FABA|nr:hypothetical protein QN277_027333 [Acacia crassicarpa]
MSHITVERNRRRQMNEHLRVLRSLTPRFYIKRGDQASIVGGVIEFIKELHQVVEVLESQKRRRKSVSPSPRGSAPITPVHHQVVDSPFGSADSSNKEVGGAVRCNSSVADVEVKIEGPNVIVKVISHRMPGQLAKIIAVLERLSFQVLYLNISTMDYTVLHHFVVKIGLDCQLSLEELAMEVQRSFSDAVNNRTAPIN